MRAPAAGCERVHLLFEGVGTLSIILSKAFLLADDAKITDPSITSQLARWSGRVNRTLPECRMQRMA